MIPGEFLLQIFKSSSLPALILLPDAPAFTIVEFNDLYLKNFQKSDNELRGREILQVFAAGSGSRIHDENIDLLRSLTAVINTKAPHKISEWKYDIIDPVTGSSQERYWDIENRPFLNQRAEIEYIVQTGTDVTQKVLLEKARVHLAAQGRNKLSDLGFKSLIQHGINLIGVLDKEGIYKYVSPTYKTILGMEPAAMIGKTSASFVHPDDLQRMIAAYPELEISKKIVLPPFRFRHGDGSWRWIETILADLTDDPEVSGLVTNSRDVTGRVIAEQELKTSEKKYKALFQLSPISKWIFDLKTLQILDVNDAAINHYGYSREEFMQMEIRDLSPTGKSPAELCADKLLKGDEGILHCGVVTHLQKNKSEIKVEVSGHRFDFNDAEGMMVVAVDVTQRENALQKMQEDSYKLLTALKIAKLGYWRLNIADELLYWSDEVCDILGANKGSSKINFESFLNYLHPDDKDGLLEAQSKALADEAELNFEHRIILPDHSVKWVHERAKLVKNAEGQSLALEGSIQDITTEKLLEISLEQTNLRYDYVSKATSDAIWDWNFISDSIYWSPGFQALFGFDLKDSRSDTDFWTNLIHPDDHDLVVKDIDKAIRGTAINWSMEYRFQRADKTYADVLDKGFLIRDAHGKATRMVGSLQDVTDRKQAERKLRDAYEERNNILESIGDAFFAIDNKWVVTYWNHMAGKVFGKSRTQIVGKNLWEENIFDNKTAYLKHFRKAFDKTSAQYFEVKMDGGNTSFEVSVFPSINGLSVYFKDVTERKEAIEKLRISNERFERVSEATNDAIWDLDLRENKLYLGQGFKKLRGENYEEFLPGDQWLDHIHPDDRPLIEAKIKKALADKNTSMVEGEYRYLTQSGSYLHILARGSIIRDENGSVTRLVGAFSDMTQRKQYEASLKALNTDLEKINKELLVSNTELEQFAYIASHDLQEPLRMITGFLSQIERKYADLIDDKGKQYIFFAVDGARRMRQIILDLLEFSRIGRLQDTEEKVDVNALVEEVRMLHQGQIEEFGAKIIIDTPLPVIRTMKSPLRQVFQNLVGNALKYHRKDTAPVISIAFEETSAYWQFSVEDNGIGIDPEYQQKIFEIFQRLHNKDEYSGTGIGLAIVKKIVESLGGRILVESTLEKGSIFFFTIKK
jgi:PAS domain S-box-containing protein